MQPKRVAYIVKRYPRFSETFILNEILAHEKAGLELEIISLYPPNDTHFQNAVEFWNALKQASRALPALYSRLSYSHYEEASEVYQAAQLAKLVKERKIGHLHAHFASTATSVARLASYFADVPYSFTAHAKDIFHESVQPLALSQKLLDASAVVTVSDYNVKFLQEHFAAPHLHRIYNGLDLEMFSFEAPVLRLPLIVAVGRLVEKKGFLDLLKACAILAKRGLTFRCDIVGDGEESLSLGQAIKDLALNNHVHLLGAKPQQEVIAKIQAASVFALPCVIGEDGNRDGLPTVLLEAMALGTACVSTNVTGIPEILRHEQTGLEVPQRDPLALANALERLLKDKSLQMRLALQARALIEREFDITRNAAKLREVFASAHRVVGPELEVT
jgi:colanic acid/amylovoran biosynthesis glycosyltransferase